MEDRRFWTEGSNISQIYFALNIFMSVILLASFQIFELRHIL